MHNPNWSQAWAAVVVGNRSLTCPLLPRLLRAWVGAHRYTWRRGSVPLWWSVTIRNGGMGEAEIKIHNTNTFRGSRR